MKDEEPVAIEQDSFSLEDDYDLTGKVLIAMPFLSDPRFTHAVIYVCGHDAQGAMGLIVNKGLPAVTFKELLAQMNVDVSTVATEVPIQYGGPVEIGRGFVLHSSDSASESTVLIENGFAMTATLDILRAIAMNEGPRDTLLALGYVGWSSGQLENEIQENGWLTIEADPALIFGHDLEGKWHKALATLGIDPAVLSFEVGHA
jgi:putative transcriptional regulator